MYIKGTITYGSSFQRCLSDEVQLEMYVDVDYAHEANDPRSVSDGVSMCASASVSFYSRTQKPITLSSTVFARWFSRRISGALFPLTTMLGVPRRRKMTR